MTEYKDENGDFLICSNCKTVFNKDLAKEFNFCPNCGTSINSIGRVEETFTINEVVKIIFYSKELRKAICNTHSFFGCKKYKHGCIECIEKYITKEIKNIKHKNLLAE